MSGPNWQYAKYILRHKWFVLLAGIKIGVPLWRLIIHDWSKFLPSEWVPYRDFFYKKPGQEQKRTAAEQRARATPEQQAAFDMAWLLHQNRHSHHWQFYVLLRDDGSRSALPMAFFDLLEMLADWRGAGRAVGFPDTLAWYTKNRANMLLHPITRAYVERFLGYVATECAECGLNVEPCACAAGVTP